MSSPFSDALKRFCDNTKDFADKAIEHQDDEWGVRFADRCRINAFKLYMAFRSKGEK